MKYKLIKLYPGSPELGTEVQKQSNSQTFFYRTGDMTLCIHTEHIEEYPEYWEKVNENIWYVVSTRNYQVNHTLFEAWFVYRIESFEPVNKEPLNYFKTKEEAELFVINHKPCLTFKEVKKILGAESEKRKVISELSNLVKSKL